MLLIPGHEDSHVAAYDPRTRSLLTGDTLYPGLLTVQDWPAYRRSAARLARFAEEHEVAQVLGSHIEMIDEPGRPSRSGRPTSRVSTRSRWARSTSPNCAPRARP